MTKMCERLNFIAIMQHNYKLLFRFYFMYITRKGQIFSNLTSMLLARIVEIYCQKYRALFIESFLFIKFQKFTDQLCKNCSRRRRQQPAPKDQSVGENRYERVTRRRVYANDTDDEDEKIDIMDPKINKKKTRVGSDYQCNIPLFSLVKPRNTTLIYSFITFFKVTFKKHQSQLGIQIQQIKIFVNISIIYYN